MYIVIKNIENENIIVKENLFITDKSYAKKYVECQNNQIQQLKEIVKENGLIAANSEDIKISLQKIIDNAHLSIACDFIKSIDELDKNIFITCEEIPYFDDYDHDLSDKFLNFIPDNYWRNFYKNLEDKCEK